LCPDSTTSWIVSYSSSQPHATIISSRTTMKSYMKLIPAKNLRYVLPHLRVGLLRAHGPTKRRGQDAVYERVVEACYGLVHIPILKGIRVCEERAQVARRRAGDLEVVIDDCFCIARHRWNAMKRRGRINGT
jgi:hypothetical protein